MLEKACCVHVDSCKYGCLLTGTVNVICWLLVVNWFVKYRLGPAKSCISQPAPYQLTGVNKTWRPTGKVSEHLLICYFVASLHNHSMRAVRFKFDMVSLSDERIYKST